eukprot:SAG22_NODE_1748_length_3664_cov_10.806171_5_plen_294_part_00
MGRHHPIDDSGAAARMADAFDATANPVATSTSRPTFADLERALDGLQAGKTSSDEVVRTMEGLFQGKVVGALQERLVAQPVPAVSSATSLDVSVRSVVAHLTKAPSNWHQMTAFYLGSRDDADAVGRRWAPAMYVSSLLIVLLQIATVSAVLIGTMIQSCETNDHCTKPGIFCIRDMPGEGNNRCEHCGFKSPFLHPQNADARTTIRGGRSNGGNGADSVRLHFGDNCVQRVPYTCEFNRTLVHDVCTSPSARMGTWEDTLREVSASSVESWCAACVHQLLGMWKRRRVRLMR